MAFLARSRVCWLVALSTGLAAAVTRAADDRLNFPGATWETRSPAALALDGERLDQFAAAVGGDGCIVRDGYLVKSWGEAARHKDWASASKPVLSTLLLLAVQEGRIPSVDSRISDLERGWSWSAKDRAITFRHLANMVSGYALDEAPGAAWAYNDYAIQLYALSLERLLGRSLDAAFRERMSELQLEDGAFFGGRGTTRVTATPRDFARLGWLWLNRGRWRDRPVIDPHLIDACFRVGVPADLPRAANATHDDLTIGTYGGGTNQTPHGPGCYGFNFWFNATLGSGQRVWPALPADAYQANGMWNRDTVTIIPSWRMVVAVRGAHAGAFEPGKVEGAFNQNLALLARAVEEGARQENARAAADLPRVPRWQPHDFAFRLAQPPANPFEVPFAATVTRPDGTSFRLPGFHDGGQTWKVRVSSDMEGAWSLRTHSSAPGLEGQTASWTCIASANPRIHGRLRVDAQHPHHFVFEDGQRFFMLGYECDWLWALDSHDPALPTVKPFLDRIAAHGFNDLILNTYAHDTSWRPGKSSDDDYGPPPLYPWGGSNEAPDHSRLNLAFWQHYDRVIHALFERGIMAHVLLKVYNKKVRWPGRGSKDDDLFFRSMIARYAAYPNLIWDFSKEAHNERDLDYKLGRVRFLRENDPYHHLITTHDDNANYESGAYNATHDFRTDQQHSKFREVILAQRRERAWPVANVEFGYEQGPNGPDDRTYRVVQTPEELVRRAWEIAMAGGYAAYYYTYTAWDVVRPADVPRGYAYFQQLRSFFESTRYWQLDPAEGVSSAGWALANPGQEYVVYLGTLAPFTLTLPRNRSGYTGEWFDPLSGRRVAAGPLVAGNTRVQPPESWKGPGVLHVRAGRSREAGAWVPQLDAIDLSGFGSGIHHWRNLRDDSRFIKVEPNQPSYTAAQVREILDNILLFQRRDGGWPKDYDMTAVLTADQRARVVATHNDDDSSYDNDNVHSQVQYLAHAVAQVDEPAWRAACERGFDYILRSQFPNGGFPQRFPRASGYQKHITFNDGVMIGALKVLHEAAERAPHFAWLDEGRRQAAASAVARGVACILRCQIRVDGKLTGWCQQHDEQSYEARPARTFELASICPQETTSIVRFLMQQKAVSKEMDQAIEAAIAWLEQVRLTGIKVERIQAEPISFQRHDTNFDVVVVPDPQARPTWARHYEIGTNRPVFAGRDAVKKYALADIERERRTGTPWYGAWPQRLLDEEYPAWRKRR